MMMILICQSDEGDVNYSTNQINPKTLQQFNKYCPSIEYVLVFVYPHAITIIFAYGFINANKSNPYCPTCRVGTADLIYTTPRQSGTIFK